MPESESAWVLHKMNLIVVHIYIFVWFKVLKKSAFKDDQTVHEGDNLWKKLFCVSGYFAFHYLSSLTEGRSWNRLCSGYVMSAGMFPDKV